MELVGRLENILAKFPEQTVLGVGDLILDHYRRGRAQGLSPEAPAIDLLNPDLTEFPGGAANVAWNVGYLGGNVRMVGVLGADAEGRALTRLLRQTPGASLVVVEDPARRTTLKLRFYAQQFQVLRVSHESNDPLSPETESQCRHAILQHVEECGAVFVEDYGKGLVSPALVEILLAVRRRHPALPVLLDPKVGNHGVYQPGMCTILKPNWKEACELAGEDPDGADRAAVAHILSETYACDVLITLGPEGILLYERSGENVAVIPTRPRDAFDVAGAGDTTLAVLSLALAAGASMLESAALANIAGGVVVEKSGTAYVTPDEMSRELQQEKTKEMLRALVSAQAVGAVRRA